MITHDTKQNFITETIQLALVPNGKKDVSSAWMEKWEWSTTSATAALEMPQVQDLGDNSINISHESQLPNRWTKEIAKYNTFEFCLKSCSYCYHTEY